MKLNAREASDFLAIPGEMARLTSEKDWSNSDVGPIASWPKSLKTLVSIVLNSKFPMFLFWGKQHISFYNDAYRPSLGENGKHPYILGTPGKEAWPEIWDIIYPLIDHVMSGKGGVWHEDQLIPIFRNGTIEDVYWTFSYSPVNDDWGNIGGVLVTCTETTEKFITKLRLQQSENRLRSMIQQAPAAITIFRGKNHLVEMVNARALQLWGTDEKSLLQKPVKNSDSGFIPKDIVMMMDHVFSTGEVYSTFEYPVKPRNDQKKESLYINFNFEPLYYDGKIDGVIAVGTDVTRQYESYKSVEASEKKFRLLADSMPQFIWTADPDGSMNYFNQSVFDFTGLSFDQLKGEGWLQIVHPADRDVNLSRWKQAINTGKDYIIEHRFRKHDGTYHWQLSRARPQRDETGNIQMWVGTSTDIEDQNRFRANLQKEVDARTKELLVLNETLRKSEERYHLMVEEVEEYAILYLNKEGIVENWNAGAEKIKGYKSNEIVGKSFFTFYTEEDRKKNLPQTLLNQAAQKGKAVQEGWRVRKDGTLFWASVVITAVHNEKKEVIGFSKVTHDLTAKKAVADALNEKTIELEQKNFELEKINKELQSFAYISSHDLQEPLRKIQTFATRISEYDREHLSEKGKELFRRMQNSAERMQLLIDDLLAYSRTHNTGNDFKLTDISEIINNVIADFREELDQKSAEITVGQMCELNVIPFQVHQLFSNLVGNSLKFAQSGKPLQITFNSRITNAGTLDFPRLNTLRSYCHISYSDNGIGFDSQYNEKIFELFQRLHGKKDFMGTGIGLAIVKRIMDNHNGYVTATGKPGEGATFNIYFPFETA